MMNICEDDKVNDKAGQRNIGKQLFLVRMIRMETKKAGKTGVSLITKKDIADWALMKTEEIDELTRINSDLDREKMAGSAALDYERELIVNDGRDVFGFLRDTFMRLDKDFLKGYSSERLAEYCRTHATENFEEYVQAYAKKPDDLLGSSYVLETGIRYYIKHLVSVVDSALQKGYDWDVISEMLWCDISREDYDLLANDFRPED